MGEITIRQALNEYETIYMASRNFAQRTRAEYLNDLEDLISFLEELGAEAVSGIGLPQLERYLAELDHRGIAGSTRKRKVVSIRSFLGYLYQDRYIRINLAKRLIPPFAEARSPRYLTKMEYERLLEACAQNARDFAVIQLLLQTGVKLSELTRLMVNDVEFPSEILPEMKDVGSLHISGSERQRERVSPLNYKACIALDAYLKTRLTKTPSSSLFVNRFEEHLSARGVEKVINKYLIEVGIRDASVQSLRHTFAIHHIFNGTSPKTIQEIMGFKDPRSTSIYVSLARDFMNKELQNNTL